MTCTVFRDQASLYLDGVMEKTQHSRFESHLDSCPHCSREMRELKKLRTLLHRLGEGPVPKDFLGGLRQKLETVPRQRRALAWRPLVLPQPQWRAALTGLLALLLLVIPVYRMTFSDEARLRAILKQIDRAVTAPSYHAYRENLMREFEIPASVVETLNVRNRGWGEITIELAMAHHLQMTQPQNYRVLGEALAQIEQFRSAGKGWRQMAAEMDFDLAPVIETSQGLLTTFQTRPRTVTRIHQEPSHPLSTELSPALLQEPVKPAPVLEPALEIETQPEVIQELREPEETPGPIQSEVQESVRDSAQATQETREAAGELTREAREVVKEAQGDAKDIVKEAREAAKETQREARETAKEAQSDAKEAVQEGREAVKETVQEAKETAKEAQGQVKETVKESQEAVKETVRETQDAAKETQSEVKENVGQTQDAVQEAVNEIKENVDIDDVHL